MAAFRVLLFSNRPAVKVFLASLPLAGFERVAVTSVPLSPENLAALNPRAVECEVVVLDVGSDPIAAVTLCRELRALRPHLPILAIARVVPAITVWHLQELVNAGVSGLVDLQATPREMAAALHDVARGQVVLRINLGRGRATWQSWRGPRRTGRCRWRSTASRWWGRRGWRGRGTRNGWGRCWTTC